MLLEWLDECCWHWVASLIARKDEKWNAIRELCDPYSNDKYHGRKSLNAMMKIF